MNVVTPIATELAVARGGFVREGDFNSFDNRTTAAMNVYPEKAHEIAATIDFVGQEERLLKIGNQLLDISLGIENV